MYIVVLGWSETHCVVQVNLALLVKTSSSASLSAGIAAVSCQSWHF